MTTFIFLEKPIEQDPSVNIDTISHSADTRQTNREKVIAESYWQHVFNEEKQNKT